MYFRVKLKGNGSVIVLFRLPSAEERDGMTAEVKTRGMGWGKNRKGWVEEVGGGSGGGAGRRDGGTERAGVTETRPR